MNKSKCIECGYEFLWPNKGSKKYCSTACAHISFFKWTLEEGNISILNNQLVFKDGTTYNQWRDFGYKLQEVNNGLQFIIGDWARFGETSKYTSSGRYNELEEITGISRRTLQDYKSVADRVGDRRRVDLSFAHHREVAYLSPEVQVKILRRAAEDKMSVRQLRVEAKKLMPSK